MNDIITNMAGVVAAATPVVVAVIGETFSERSGVVNLSANGLIVLSAMIGFAVAYTTGVVWLGFLGGFLAGALAGILISFSSISLKQSQVAVGFILSMLFRDLAYFLGTPFMIVPGPTVKSLPIPFLQNIPVIGPLFFQQNVLVYFSYILIAFSYIWIFHTPQGLILRGVGEQPTSAYSRGINVNRVRYFYTALGAGLIGLAGPMYSLSIKAGWNGTMTGLDGIGWIVLSITIFGGWNTLRGAFGAYLFVFLQWLGLVLQTSLVDVPSQVLQVAPFPLMILTLLFVNIGDTEWVTRTLARLPRGVRGAVYRLIRFLRKPPPASLGVPFERE
jgi:general nucleoside transport system permease protein